MEATSWGRTFEDEDLGLCTVARCGKFGVGYVLYYVDNGGTEECSSVPEVRKWIGGDEKTTRRFGVITKVHKKGISYQVK